MRKMRVCPCCESYDVCKFWETLRDVPISDAVEFSDERSFNKWKTMFARWCLFFKMDKTTVDYLIALGLDFIYHGSLGKVKK